MLTDKTKYIVIKQIEEKYNACKQIIDNNDVDLIKNDLRRNLLNLIEELYVVFCKYLKFEYDEQMPAKLLTLAKDSEYAEIADMWLEYIEDYNQYFNKEDNSDEYYSKNTIISYIVKKYYPRLFCIEKFLNSAKIMNILDEYNKEEYPYKLNFDNCKYTQEVGVDEKTYTILQEYLKTVPVVNAWLYKEEYSVNQPPSLYLITDCNPMICEYIQNKFNKLNIPYFIELKNIYKGNDLEFAKYAMSNGAYRIYNDKIIETKLPEHFFEYTRWQDYYREVFLREYSEAEALTEKINEPEVIYNYKVTEQLCRLYNSANTLIRYYMGNNGLLVRGTAAVIKNAFRIGFLNNGEDWIKLDYMISEYNDNGGMVFRITDFIIKEKFYLFEEINDRFKSLLEEHD